MRKSKKDDSGVKLEVNGRILDSCTDLMGVGLYTLSNSGYYCCNITVHQTADPEITRASSGNSWSRKGDTLIL